ncbi:MAG: T9SS type A sorting domain-containing protein [bacterium]|nr:T9SS type A sorting domain-containing protein [bacterium]
MRRPTILFAFISNLLICSVSYSQYNLWEYKTAMPTARTWLGSTVLDNKLFVVGGCPTNSATNKVEAYDPIMDTWLSINNLPSARCYEMTCSFNNKIYVFGGSMAQFGTSSSTVYEFDLQTGNWTQKADMPDNIGGAGIAVVGELIYIIGGTHKASSSGDPTAKPVSTIWAYDPVAETWTQKADLPTARLLLSACVIDGKIYAIGGTTENWENVFYKVVEVYDPAANIWTQKADMPTGRWGSVACVLDGQIYVIGGRAGANSSTKNEVYDPVADSWVTKAPMQQDRVGLAGGTIDNKIYVAGGHHYPPQSFLSSCEEYTPELSNFESDSVLLPEKIELFQNYPNPFNPSTVISYQLPVSSDLVLKVFDVLGNGIETLVDEEKPAGTYEVTWYPNNLPSGVYFYQLLVSALQSKDGKAGSFVETKKMILLK